MSGWKTCYYDLLGLERNCTDDDIKKAYRKTALRFHPDKALLNDMDVEEATAKFQDIQEAHETLSNPNERAWYDSHREQILSGKDIGEGEDLFAEELNLWQYFGKRYPFDDGPKGFYTNFRHLFEKIHSEEMHYQEDPRPAPTFGNSTSPSKETNAFYQYWMNFISNRPFGYADLWRTQDGGNRQVRRLMEKENKSAQNAARKEYMNSVRQLATRIQNRDPRIFAKKEEDEKKRLEKIEKDKAEKIEKEAQRKVEREEARKIELARWAEIDAEREAKGEVGEDSDDESDVLYYCEACEKQFKSEKQLNSHCKSKKHKKAWEEFMTRQLEEMEESELEEDDDEEEEEDDDESPISSSKYTTSPQSKNTASFSPAKRVSQKSAQSSSSSSSSSSGSSFNFGAFARPKKKAQPVSSSSSSEEDEAEDTSKQENKTIDSVAEKISKDDADDQIPDDKLKDTNTDDAEEETKEPDEKKDNDDAEEETKEPEEKKEDDDEKENISHSSSDDDPKSNKKKGRRRNKGAAAKSDAARNISLGRDECALKCGGCNEKFTSKNALFTHLRKFPDHALLKTQEKPNPDVKTKGKLSKKKTTRQTKSGRKT